MKATTYPHNNRVWAFGARQNTCRCFLKRGGDERRGGCCLFTYEWRKPLLVQSRHTNTSQRRGMDMEAAVGCEVHFDSTLHSPRACVGRGDT